jgi:hypothetical protein
LEQENLGPQELAEWKQREEQQAEQERSRRAGRKPLTRRGLAAMVDDGGPSEAVHVQVQLRPDKLRRSNGSGASLDNAAAAAAASFSSPPPPQSATRSPTQGSPIRCPKCSQSFARQASFERHVAACKIGERNCTSDSSRNTSSSSSGSDADDEEDESAARRRDGDHEASPKRLKASKTPRGAYGQRASKYLPEQCQSVNLL